MSRSRPTNWLDRVALTLRTVRYLRAAQVAHRVSRRLRQTRWSGFPHVLVQPDTRWHLPQRMPVALRGDSEWLFMNRKYPVDESTWDDPQRPLLWRYHLHYFDDLRGSDAQKYATLLAPWLDRWIAQNPPSRGTGWAPYPISKRIVSWIAWATSGHPFPQSHVDSLAIQAEVLSRKLEFDLAANHLLANAKAMLFAGTVLQGPLSEKWQRMAHAILGHEIGEQILSDGGHFERTPMYHAVILEDLLDIIQLSRLYPANRLLKASEYAWRSSAARMCRFLAHLTHPDGEVAFFNDSTGDFAPRPERLFDYARHLDIRFNAVTDRLTHFEATGFGFARAGDLTLFMDIGSLGPEYQPGHAHAGTLSFELSLGKERIVANTGCSTYETGDRRHFERSTAAHSTVEIDAEDSSEIWQAFRVARRARVLEAFSQSSDGEIQFAGSHDGYRRLPGRPIHRRVVRMTERTVSIEDEITGHGRHDVRGRLCIHPDVAISPVGSTECRLHTASGRRFEVHSLDGIAFIHEKSSYAPQFGCIQERPVISWHWNGELPCKVRILLQLK
jgi:uncharacterized heparinase superfamily protein